MGAQNFEILLENAHTSGQSLIAVRKEYLLLFISSIVNFVWKTEEGETESIIMLIFVLGAF